MSNLLSKDLKYRIIYISRKCNQIVADNKNIIYNIRIKKISMVISKVVYNEMPIGYLLAFIVPCLYFC
jgi:hypothetical protein